MLGTDTAHLPPIDPHLVIETARLRIVPLDERWAPEVFVEYDEEITRWMTAPPAKDLGETEAFIRSAKEEMARGTDLFVVFLHKETREHLGNGGVHGLHKPSPAVGLWVKKSAHGSGYGREAIGGLIEWARQNYDFAVVRYDVDRANLASRHIAEHYGGVLAREYLKQTPSGKILDLVEYDIPLR